MMNRRASSLAAYATAIHGPSFLTARQGVAIAGLAASTGSSQVLGSGLRGFATSAPRLDSSKKPDQEELDELAREAKLRARFANKQQGSGVFGNMFGGCGTTTETTTTSSTSSSSGSSGSGTTNEAQLGEVITKIGPFKFVKRKIPAGSKTGGMSTSELLIWMLSLYTLVIYYMSWDPRRRSWHGIEWWAQPVEATAVWLLTRVILPSKERAPIRQQYYAMTKANQTINFGQYLAQFHPNVLDGHRYTQPEIIAAMIAVLANSEDLYFSIKVSAKVGFLFASSDSKKNADIVMEALKADHAHLFSSGSGMGGMAIQQQQQQQMQMQQPQFSQQMQMPMMIGGGGGGMGGASSMMMMPPQGGSSAGGSPPPASWGGVQASGSGESGEPPAKNHDFSAGGGGDGDGNSSNTNANASS